MNAIEKKRAQRFLYLKRLYELSGGDKFSYFPFLEIGRELGWDDAATNEIIDYLEDERLIHFPTFGTVSMTHAGVKLIEKALSNPDRSTGYFPPANIIIVVNGDFTIGGDFVGRNKTTSNTGGDGIVGRDVAIAQQALPTIDENSVLIYPFKNPPYNAVEMHYLGGEPIKDLEVWLIFTNTNSEVQRKQVEEFFPRGDDKMIWRQFKANVLKRDDVVLFRLLQKKHTLDGKVIVEASFVGAQTGKAVKLKRDFVLEL